MAVAVPVLFSNILHLPRTLYLIPYALIMGVLVMVYLRRRKFSAGDLTRHWLAGLAVAVAVAASTFVIASLDRYSESARPEGVDLAFALAWVGGVYGLVDALVLNVFPVVLVQFGAHGHPHAVAADGRARRRALLISMGITLVYHLGYPEFRNTSVAAPVFGNVVITATYVLSGNPLAPILMHVGAVLQGMESLPQLPPHAGASFSSEIFDRDDTVLREG